MIPPAASAPRVRKHLMVAGQTRAPSPTSRSTVAVQRWVVTVLLISVAFHFAGGLAFAAYFAAPRGLSSQVGLLVIAAVIGSLAVGAALAIHQRGPLTLWMIWGLLPSLVGVYFCFLR
ncbi:MAG: hypothetical protein LH477_06450 [Nocardioides sp.]|nr:hypothetical protein [Nocardioides sp.]